MCGTAVDHKQYANYSKKVIHKAHAKPAKPSGAPGKTPRPHMYVDLYEVDSPAAAKGGGS